MLPGNEIIIAEGEKIFSKGEIEIDDNFGGGHQFIAFQPTHSGPVLNRTSI